MKKSSSFNVLLGEGALQNRWRQNTGASFIRIRKKSFRSQFIYLILIILIVLIVYISLPTNRHHFRSYQHLQAPTQQQSTKNEIPTNSVANYNARYPLTKPIVNVHEKTTTYKIGLIADLDTNSRSKRDNEYLSYFKSGWVTISSTHTSFNFKFDVDSKEISSGYSLKGKLFKSSTSMTYRNVTNSITSF
jgi:hypothetical protein